MSQLSHYQQRIQAALLAQLPPISEQPTQLHQAMHYAVFNGGKRLRPLLVYATGDTLKADLNKLDILACAVEFVHTYSLIHDDLPAMDDDDFRRGKPSCHKEFDEATAILAGDALQTLAFASLTGAPKAMLSDIQRLQAIDALAIATGSRGMAGGQALDLIAVGQQSSLADVENLYRMKTGALINSCVMMGIIAANIGLKSTPALALQRYADCVSLAFQIQDDILDVDNDSQHDKPTYAAIAGLEAAKEKVSLLKKEALLALDALRMPADPLKQVTNIILK